MKIFGSDGFRSKVGTKFLTEEFLVSFSEGFSKFCIQEKISNPIAIGRDTRKSGKDIEALISDVFGKNGLEVVLVGVISTPGLSNVLRDNCFSYGIMITASHNPSEDNGIKLFGSEGYKLDSDNEKIIENLILNSSSKVNSKKVLSIKKNYELVRNYNNKIYDKFNKLKISKKYLLDGSNGSNSELCKLLSSKFTNFFSINNVPNGDNINLNCGALEPDNLLEATKEMNADYGISFDGDGDRIIFCSKDYGTLETEKVIFLFAKHFSKHTKVPSVVSTIISNLALNENLNQIGIKLLETDLGDRLVVDKTRSSSSLLGAETSGHFYFPNESNTMDGMLAFFNFIKIVDRIEFDPKDYFSRIKHYKRETANVSINKKCNILSLRNRLDDFSNFNEKIVVRESMWDPVIRIYYDYKENNRFKEVMKILNEHV